VARVARAARAPAVAPAWTRSACVLKTLEAKSIDAGLRYGVRRQHRAKNVRRC
jgi:hypothetical protein